MPSSLAFRSLDWGTQHPEYAKKDATLRIRWTPIEKNFIGHWIQEAYRQGYKSHGISTRCLIDIKANYPEMIAHFHKNHVIDVNKFAHGYKMYIKENNA